MRLRQGRLSGGIRDRVFRRGVCRIFALPCIAQLEQRRLTADQAGRGNGASRQDDLTAVIERPDAEPRIADVLAVFPAIQPTLTGAAYAARRDAARAIKPITPATTTAVCTCELSRFPVATYRAKCSQLFPNKS
jgi:hypothetical protein